MVDTVPRVRNTQQVAFLGNFIDGRFVRPERGERLVSEDPGDLGHPVGEILADPDAISEAAAAARAAFPAWRDLSWERREDHLRRYQKALLERKEELAELISRETGKLWQESLDEVAAMAEKVELTIGQALPLVAEQSFAAKGGGRAVTRFMPRGVVGIIGPFNVPGHLPNGQIVPALATGNTVVFKPSPLTPFVGQFMAELFRDCGLPAGVFNLVQGGAAAGTALAGEASVDVLFFTGSSSTGARVKEISDRLPGRLLALEMGGKNAALLLADAPWETAIEQIFHGAYATSGQRCSSTSRVLVHRSVAQRFLENFSERVGRVRPGHYTEPTIMGPLISERAVEKFVEAQRTAESLGFTAVLRGDAVPHDPHGRYVRPSLHAWEGFPSKLLLGPRDYWDEELFAPDVAVYALDSEDEMVELNNASQFGLAASVFTSNEAVYRRLLPRLQNGVVHWNRSTAMTPGSLPFGGVKASGNGRPAGLFAVYACTWPMGSLENPEAK